MTCEPRRQFVNCLFRNLKYFILSSFTNTSIRLASLSDLGRAKLILLEKPPSFYPFEIRIHILYQKLVLTKYNMMNYILFYIQVINMSKAYENIRSFHNFISIELLDYTTTWEWSKVV